MIVSLSEFATDSEKQIGESPAIVERNAPPKSESIPVTPFADQSSIGAVQWFEVTFVAMVKEFTTGTPPDEDVMKTLQIQVMAGEQLGNGWQTVAPGRMAFKPVPERVNSTDALQPK